MFSIPYNTSKKSLYQPGDATDFFQYGLAQLKTNAALCAEMSRLAYVSDEQNLTQYLKRGGFSLVEAVGYKTNGTQVFIAQQKTEAHSVAVVAFRGTEPQDPSDIATDARLLKKSWQNFNGKSLGKVHEGFANALLSKNILKTVIHHLTALNAAEILITGHSLGAALATLLLSYLAESPLAEKSFLCTFGSPRVGDNDFAAQVKSAKHARYVNCCDLVTRMPPESFGYVHVGDLHYIDKEGRVHQTIDEEVISQDRQSAFADYLKSHSYRKGTVYIRELADHSPINYVSATSGLRACCV